MLTGVEWWWSCSLEVIMGKKWAILKSVFYSRMNEEAVGLEIRNQPFRITPEDSVAYARACEDTNPAYKAEDGALVHPLFASRILKDGLEEILLSPRVEANMIKLVHAEQSFQWHKPLRVGMELVPVSRISAIRDVSSGQVLDIDVALEEAGKAIVSGRSSMFVRCPPKKGAKRTKEPYPFEPEMEELSTFAVLRDQPGRYAAASGDYNPIHTNALVAKLAGFERPIAHGLCVMAMTARELIAAYGEGDPASLKKIALRFSKPVYPGKDLTVKSIRGGKIQFVVELKPGKRAISNGQAEFGR